MNEYQCIKQRLYHQDLGEYTTYGLCVNGRYVVEDIRNDRQFVEELASTFNLLQLEPLHLLEVLDDLL